MSELKIAKLGTSANIAGFTEKYQLPAVIATF